MILEIKKGNLSFVDEIKETEGEHREKTTHINVSKEVLHRLLTKRRNYRDPWDNLIRKFLGLQETPRFPQGDHKDNDLESREFRSIRVTWEVRQKIRENKRDNETISDTLERLTGVKKRGDTQ